jgi:hypothetical protein
MNKYEKLSLSLSILALVISISVPIASYYWFDPTLKQFGLRGRLQVSSSKDERDYHNEIIRAIIMEETPKLGFNVEIVNIGELPANGIQIISQYFDQATDGGVTFEPILQYESTCRGSQKFIMLKRPLAPHDKLKITFNDNPDKISISNEFGETSIIDSDLGSFRVEASIMNMIKERGEKERKKLDEKKSR